MRIYMDNCCYNRPYDDQAQMRIYLEAQAKIFIQNAVKAKKIELVTSFMLDYENGNNRDSKKRELIQEFMDNNGTYYVGRNNETQIRTIAQSIMDTGIKEADAIHVACAVFSQCDYFVTTDNRILKYQGDEISLVSPTEFVREWRE